MNIFKRPDEGLMSKKPERLKFVYNSTINKIML